MSQENKETAGKKDSQMMTISLISLLIVLLFIIEIYEIVNDPANLVVIGSIGVFTLAAVYAQMYLIGRMIKKSQADQEEAFNNVYRSEKASYLLMRKYFDQLEEKMDSFNSQISDPYQDLIAAQKALAKIQINRSKQNANALLISNDKMLHKISEFQKELVNANTGLSNSDKAAFVEGNKDILDKQQEILSALKELEISLKNEILESANKMASIKSQQMAMPESQVSAEENQLQSLDIENELQLDVNTLSQPAAENSSESDLDKLLMGMNYEEPELQPIDSETKLQAMIDEPELGSIIGDTDIAPLDIDEPVMSDLANENDAIASDEIMSVMVTDGVNKNNEEPQIQPMMEDMELQPIMEEPELQSIMEAPELQPIMEEPELQPIMDEAELGSIADNTDIGSMKNDESMMLDLENEVLTSDEIAAMMADIDLSENMAESEVQSVIEQPQLEPMANEMELQPILVEPEELQPIMTETEIQPMMADSEFQSLASESENIMPELQRQTTMDSELEIQPISETESEMQPVGVEESEAQPQTIMSETEPKLQPVGVEESEAQPQTIMSETEPKLQPIGVEESEVQLQSMMSETEPKLQPIERVESEPKLRPIMTESDLEAMLNNIDDNPRSAIQSKSRRTDLVDTDKTMMDVKEQNKDSSKEKLFDTSRSEENRGRMPDSIRAKIAKLGSNVEEANADLEVADNNESQMKNNHAESVVPEIKPIVEKSTESELDQIMKAMDIDDILETPEEDLDIDKILEVPLSGMTSDMSDTSSSEQVMNSEEIAALIANTNLLSEPEPKKNDEIPDLSDPGYVMSSDEIAALIANL